MIKILCKTVYGWSFIIIGGLFPYGATSTTVTPPDLRWLDVNSSQPQHNVEINLNQIITGIYQTHTLVVNKKGRHGP